MIEGKCPYCGGEITVDASNGLIHKKTRAQGDAFNETLKRISEDKVKRKTLFENVQQDLSKKKKESDELFKKGLDEIKEKGLGDKPIREIDL